MSDIPRTGDVVRHAPTGEEWEVAWCDGERLAPAGWPSCVARLADCTLTERCSDAYHAECVARWKANTGSRAAKVRELYPDLEDAPPSRPSDDDDERTGP